MQQLVSVGVLLYDLLIIEIISLIKAGSTSIINYILPSTIKAVIGTLLYGSNTL